MMTRLFLSNSRFLLLLKCILTFLIMLVFLLHNINMLQHFNSLFTLGESLNKDLIEYKVICLLDFNHDSIDSDTMNQLYKELKSDENVIVEYSYYVLSEHVLYMDADTYRELYDSNYNGELPSVLVPSARLKEVSTYKNMKVVGSNEKVEADFFKYGSYDPLVDYIVLYDDIIVDKWEMNYVFTQGQEFILAVRNEEDVSKIQNLLTKVSDAFLEKGYIMKFLNSRRDNQISHADKTSHSLLERTMLQNISTWLILISSILVLDQILILSAKKIIALCLFGGKTKITVYKSMLLILMSCDVISSFFILPFLLKQLYEPQMIMIILTIIFLIFITVLFDAIALAFLVYKTDSKTLLLQIKRNEE